MKTDNAMTDIDLRPIRGFNLDLDQYFGLWAVEDSRFQAMLDRVKKLDLALHVQTAGEAPRAGVKIQEGEETVIAVISLAALIRHQNHRSMNSSPVPAPIWSMIWNTSRAWLMHKDNSPARIIRPTVDMRPTRTSFASVASGSMNRL